MANENEMGIQAEATLLAAFYARLTKPGRELLMAAVQQVNDPRFLRPVKTIKKTLPPLATAVGCVQTTSARLTSANEAIEVVAADVWLNMALRRKSVPTALKKKWSAQRLAVNDATPFRYFMTYDFAFSKESA